MINVYFYTQFIRWAIFKLPLSVQLNIVKYIINNTKFIAFQFLLTLL